MKKFLLLVLSALLLTSNFAYAEDISTTTCPGAGCVTYNTNGQGSIGIQITGTWSGTITFRSTVDGSNYVSQRMIPVADTAGVGVTTTTANGAWQTTSAGLTQVRVVFTSYSSGTAVVTARMTQQAGAFTGTAGIAPGTYAPVDATYITQTANSTLTAEQALGSLATGLMNNTTTTGVVSTLAPTDDNVVVGNGTAWQLKAITNCTGAGAAVTYATASNAFGCNTITSSPGGSTTEFQYNSAGAFAGLSGLTFASSTVTENYKHIQGNVYGTAPTNISSSGYSHRIGGDTAGGWGAVLSLESNNNEQSNPSLWTFSSEGTQASPAISVATDPLFEINSNGRTASAFANGGVFRFVVDGTPDSTVPTKLQIDLYDDVGGIANYEFGRTSFTLEGVPFIQHYTGTIGITVDGAGSALTTGVKGFGRVPAAATITRATLLSTDASATNCSAVFDIWVDTFANYPPTVADTITAMAKPTLSTDNESEDATLTGWTTSIAANSMVGYNIDSVSGCTRLTLLLALQY